jgi:hypothetical protein
MPQNMRCGLEQRIGLFEGDVGIVALFRRSDEIQLLSHVRGFDVLKFEVGRVFGEELLLTGGD